MTEFCEECGDQIRTNDEVHEDDSGLYHYACWISLTPTMPVTISAYRFDPRDAYEQGDPKRYEYMERRA